MFLVSSSLHFLCRFISLTETEQMKIQCDVCQKEEALLFCTADEAALCDACDRVVHHANKLVSKHQRFSLLHPSSNLLPICDVCQERRAFLFCRQDRAILCRECDFPLHMANEHTQKHSRFLLSGVKLSATSSFYSSSSSSNSSATINDTDSMQKTVSPTTTLQNMAMTYNNWEYLRETVPGWQFEDLLHPVSSPPYGLCKSGTGDNVLPYLDNESGNMGLWVPQNPSPLNLAQTTGETGLKETKVATEASSTGRKGGWKLRSSSPTPFY